jgi:hypothetical protein
MIIDCSNLELVYESCYHPKLFRNLDSVLLCGVGQISYLDKVERYSTLVSPDLERKDFASSSFRRGEQAHSD